MEKSIYQFSVKNMQGQKESLDIYRGKVIIIANVASNCRYTAQYAELEALYQKYKDKGLVIIGFPCNQFAGQEPGSDKDIKQFCQLNFGVTFPLMAKIDVNGIHADPLFSFLKSSLPGILGLKSIKWNFTKFLINRDGVPVARFAPKDRPVKMEKEILQLL